MSNDHLWTGWAGSYALGTLDNEERRTFEVHLETCAACRSELRAQRDIVTTLGRAVPHHEPPSGLRDRILDEARRVRPLRAGTATPPSPPDGRSANATGARAPAPSTASAAAGARWLAAAAVIAAIGLTALLVRERESRRELDRTVTALADSAARMDARIAELDLAVAERDSLIAAVLSPDVRTARLVAEGQPPSARIYWNRDRGRIVIAAADLSTAPAGRTYQLWGIAGGQAPVSLGTFNTGTDGRVVATFDVPATTMIDVAAVTDDPAGGSPQPTSQPFLVGGVSPL
jgi:anti-sigma-K factor RskA